jgi:flavin reductase (DIM6/NTAB) family NADH-FMN oxidoreductase RutF
MTQARTQATSPAAASDALASHPTIDPRDLRNALGCFGTGVTIITAVAADGRRVGLTANSFSSVSLNPPLVLWSLVAHSPNLPIFQEASHFTVNVLARQQEALARHFARHAEDKFAGIDCTPGLGGAPILEGALAHFECRNASRYYGGDHVIFLGAVEAYRYSAGEPLLFSRGQFGAFDAGD